MKARKKLHIFRHVFTIASGISLVLCLATIALWVRGYVVGSFKPTFALWSSRAQDAGMSLTASSEGISLWQLKFSGGRLLFDVPNWLLAILFAILPTIWLIQFRRRKRIPPGHCPTCGYDLRVQLALSERSESNGPVTPPRCPECGLLLGK